MPGFELSGLAENSGLLLQTLSRPVRNSNPIENRVFWYWDPTSSADDKVEVSPAKPHANSSQCSGEYAAHADNIHRTAADQDRRPCGGRYELS